MLNTFLMNVVPPRHDYNKAEHFTDNIAQYDENVICIPGNYDPKSKLLIFYT